MDAGKGDISEYRSKLDKTLASRDLTDQETLHVLVKNQILQSSNFEYDGNMRDLVETRTKEVSNILNLLRSASSIDLATSNSRNEPDRTWKIKKDMDEFRIMYREGPVGTPFHELLVEGYVDGPLDVCLCVAWESKLYKEWWPQISVPSFRVISSECLKRTRNGEQISVVRMKLPWPLSTREAMVHFFTFEFFEDDLIVVLFNSISDSATQALVPDAAGVVRIDVVGGIVQQKIDANRSYFRTVATIDIKLDIVPPSLINFISRQIIGSGFKLYKKEVDSVSKGKEEKFTPYLNDPLYNRIREVLYSGSVVSLDSESSERSIAEISIDADHEHAVVVSGSFRHKNEANEIDEVEENHVNENGSPEKHGSDEGESVVPISPLVKQALETLDMAISMLREHGKQQGIEETGDKTNENSTESSKLLDPGFISSLRHKPCDSYSKIAPVSPDEIRKNSCNLVSCSMMSTGDDSNSTLFNKIREDALCGSGNTLSSSKRKNKKSRLAGLFAFRTSGKIQQK